MALDSWSGGYRDRRRFEVVSEVIYLGFGDSFSVCGNCDKYGFLLYVSDVMTCVTLSFGVTGWVGCGVYVEVLFQEVILSFRFF